MGSTYKGKNLLLREQILLLYELTPIEKGGKINSVIFAESVPTHLCQV